MANKNLTLKNLLKRHEQNPEDKELHDKIEKTDVDDKTFDELVKEGTKHEAFDKKD